MIDWAVYCLCVTLSVIDSAIDTLSMYVREEEFVKKSTCEVCIYVYNIYSIVVRYISWFVFSVYMYIHRAQYIHISIYIYIFIEKGTDEIII